MSKPTGKCVFCGNQGDLTKSHIWPEWAETILPQRATHHEQIIGEFATFTPKMAGPTKWRKVRPGHVGTRRPRNTCRSCNGGWMREIEEASMADMPSLLLGNPRLLSVASQKSLAAFLCLVTMRVESTSQMRTIPQSDRDLLRTQREPPSYWKIWIARHEGNARMDERFTAMQIASSPDTPMGVEYCNSQVTTLVIGHLCAHLFSSSEWGDFGGYHGIDLRRIWPLNESAIEVAFLPVVLENAIPWLHEAVARESPFTIPRS
jgi:hypothetical protein